MTEAPHVWHVSKRNYKTIIRHVNDLLKYIQFIKLTDSESLLFDYRSRGVCFRTKPFRSQHSCMMDKVISLERNGYEHSVYKELNRRITRLQHDHKSNYVTPQRFMQIRHICNTQTSSSPKNSCRIPVVYSC